MPGSEKPLGALLDEVHAALRQGKLAVLADLASAIEARLHAGDVPRDMAPLAALRRKLERNRACLEASGRGLRAARRRLAEIAGVSCGLQTYSAEGQITRIAVPDGRLARRF